MYIANDEGTVGTENMPQGMDHYIGSPRCTDCTTKQKEKETKTTANQTFHGRNLPIHD